MKTLLPAIHNEPSVATQGEVWMNERAAAFADAWLSLLSRERLSLMRYDSRLAMCAQDHAEYLDSRTGLQLLESMHLGKFGTLSNERAIAAGYELPDAYRPHANNIESCSRDSRDPATVLLALAAHETHYAHMHCVNGFELHLFYGVGNCNDDWVAITAPMEAL